MLEKCVNPFCNHPFRYLSHGKLFAVEFPRRVTEPRHHVAGRREHFWLCEECARLMTVAVRREFDDISVRIINLSPNGATKLKFVPPADNRARVDHAVIERALPEFSATFLLQPAF